MKTAPLTALKIERLKSDPNKRLEIPDGAQAGLFLILQSSGKRGFAVRYRFNGVPKKLTLRAGVSLADARKLAADAMYELSRGTDPGAAKKIERQKAATEAAALAANSLQSICERYLKREGGKLRSVGARESALRRGVYPVMGHRIIDTIKRSEITQLLDKIEDRNGSRAADLVLSYLRKIFNWHAIQSDEFRSPIVKGMGRYDYTASRRKRFLNDAEIKAFWQATEDGGPIGSVLRFLLLTGCRRTEGAHLRWDELAGHEWLLPAARHKNKHTDLLRPLSDAALAIVQAQPRIDNSPYVFSNNGVRPIAFGSASRRFMKGMSIAEGWAVHDLRRTSRTLLSRAGVDSDIAEKCLGHLPGSIVQTYDQHRYQNEMRVAFESLATLIGRIVNPPPALVTPMRRRG
jgi:integrase